MPSQKVKQPPVQVPPVQQAQRVMDPQTGPLRLRGERVPRCLRAMLMNKTQPKHQINIRGPLSTISSSLLTALLARCGRRNAAGIEMGWCGACKDPSSNSSGAMQIREAAIQAGHLRVLDATYSHQRYKSFGQIAIPKGADVPSKFLAPDVQPYANMFLGRSVRLRLHFLGQGFERKIVAFDASMCVPVLTLACRCMLLCLQISAC